MELNMCVYAVGGQCMAFFFFTKVIERAEEHGGDWQLIYNRKN